MAEETATVEATEETKTPEEEQRVPYERFQQANKKAKEAADRAAALEKDLNDLRSRMEERDAEGLPERERERKRAEQLEQRIKDAEARAEQSEKLVARTQRERWLETAAQDADFRRPGYAVKLIDDIDAIESKEDAERAVKRLVKADPDLVKPEDSPQPQIGRVLEARNGSKAQGGVDLSSEAEMLAEGLKRFASRD